MSINVCTRNTVFSSHIHEGGRCYQPKTSKAQEIRDDWKKNDINFRWHVVLTSVSFLAGAIFSAWFVASCSLNPVAKGIGIGCLSLAGKTVYAKITQALDAEKQAILVHLRERQNEFTVCEWNSPGPAFD
jgi:hypothetical protein